MGILLQTACRAVQQQFFNLQQAYRSHLGTQRNLTCFRTNASAACGRPFPFLLRMRATRARGLLTFWMSRVVSGRGHVPVIAASFATENCLKFIISRVKSSSWRIRPLTGFNHKYHPVEYRIPEHYQLRTPSSLIAFNLLLINQIICATQKCLCCIYVLYIFFFLPFTVNKVYHITMQCQDNSENVTMHNTVSCLPVFIF